MAEEFWFRFRNPYWSEKMKVSFLQRRVIVASIQYYQMDGSVIEDLVYERISKQLLYHMSKLTKEELLDTEYGYCMADYDGSTGFYLYDSLNEHDKKYLMNIAMLVKRGGD